MKQIRITLISLLVMSTFVSCSVMESFCTQVWNSVPIDNTGATYHRYSQQEAMDIVMNTREAQAWNSSTGSKSLLIADAGLDLIGSLTDKDFSEARDIINNTIDDLVADKNTTHSLEQSLIGAAFYGASNAIKYVEDKHIAEDNARFRKEHKNTPNFNCRYKINPKTGRYIDIQKHYGIDSVMKCIRDEQEEEYRLMLDSAVRECAPFEDLDELLTKSGDERIDSKRHKILYDALKCFNDRKRVEAYENEVNGVDENLVLSHNAEPDTQNTAESGDSQPTEDNLAASFVQVLSDEEIIENIKTSNYRFKSYTLSDQNKAELDKAFDILQRNPEMEIELLGHSCNIGDQDAKYIVGIQRAKAAKQYLVDKGIDAKRIYVHSYGDKKPLVKNDSPANRATNRRVEIKIIK